MRIAIVYICQCGFALGAAYISYITDLFPWYYTVILILPLALSSISWLSGITYAVNARILFPISSGLFFLTLYHYFPEIAASNGFDTSGAYGISNPGDLSVGTAFFESNDLFTDAVAVLYAICVAFLLWKGLTDFDELKIALYDEANEIGAMVDYLQYFADHGENENSGISHAIVGLFETYISNIVVGTKVVISRENTMVLGRIIGALASLEPKDFNDRIALEEIMKGYSRLVSARARRHVCVQKTMSPFILAIILLMSVTMIASFFGSADGIVSVNHLYVFLLSFFYTAIFMTLIDLSAPFDGYWSIKLEAFEDLRARLAEARENGLQPDMTA